MPATLQWSVGASVVTNARAGGPGILEDKSMADRDTLGKLAFETMIESVKARSPRDVEFEVSSWGLLEDWEKQTWRDTAFVIAHYALETKDAPLRLGKA